jgi:hypothetical protein
MSTPLRAIRLNRRRWGGPRKQLKLGLINLEAVDKVTRQFALPAVQMVGKWHEQQLHPVVNCVWGISISGRSIGDG